MTTSFSVVIPTYNGLFRLQQNLPVLMPVFKRASEQCEIIIVDDGSSDGSVEWLGANYPAIRVLANPINAGFIASVNRGVDAAANEVVFLLNNDITAKGDFASPVPALFNDKDLFAVTFRALYPGTLSFREGAKAISFQAGFIKILHSERHMPKPLADGRIPSFYPVGGHCAIRRSMYLELAGMDPLYAPFYWEDADLGYRAWKKGWKTVYAPECEVIHDDQGTIKSLHAMTFIRNTRCRNRLLFMWKNLDNKPWLLMHAVFLLLRLLFSWLWLDFRFYASLKGAILRIAETAVARKKRKARNEARPDDELQRILAKNG